MSEDFEFDVNNLTEENAVDFLNKNCKSPEDAKHWLEFFQNRLKNVDSQVDGGENVSLGLLNSITDEARNDLEKLRELKKTRETLLRKITTIKLETEEFVDSLREKCEHLSKLEKRREQLKTLQEFNVFVIQ